MSRGFSKKVDFFHIAEKLVECRVVIVRYHEKDTICMEQKFHTDGIVYKVFRKWKADY